MMTLVPFPAKMMIHTPRILTCQLLFEEFFSRAFDFQAH